MRAVVTLDDGPLGVQVATGLRLRGWTVETWHSAEGHLPPNRPDGSIAVDFAQPIALERALEGIDVLFHCRRLGALGDSHRDEVYRVNLEETAHLLTAARLAGVQRFVYRGSIFGVGSPGAPGHSNPKPWDLLGLRLPLVQGDRLALLEAERQGTLGLSLSILLPPMLLGPGGALGADPILKALGQGRLPVVPRKAIGLVDPRDLAEAMVRAVAHPPGTHVFPGTPTTWGALGALIASNTGARAPLPILPSPLLRALAKGVPKSAMGQGWALMARDWDYGRGGLFGVTPRPLTESVADWAQWALLG